MTFINCTHSDSLLQHLDEKAVDGFANLLADTSLSCNIGMTSEMLLYYYYKHNLLFF